MIPQPHEFFDLFSTDQLRREAVAAAERHRGPGGLRTRSASLLRGLADQLSPLPAPPRAASVSAAPGVRPTRSRCHPVV
jgi:hypothetical protein